MAKLVVVCSCGQQSRVPYSALGRIGLCPACGGTVRITRNNTHPEDTSPRVAPDSVRPAWTKTQAAPSPDAIERFGRGVDLYNQARYGEALAVFNALAQEMPDTPEIEQARSHCIAALRRPRLAEPASTVHAATLPDDLTETEVRRVILEKMRSGSSEADRLQLDAARLAAEVLGLIGRPAPDREGAASEGPRTTSRRRRSPSDNGEAGADGQGAAPEKPRPRRRRRNPSNNGKADADAPRADAASADDAADLQARG